MPEDQATDVTDDGAEATTLVEGWEFVDETPTTEKVKALLETLPPVWGVKTVEFIDYVIGLPQNKKVKTADDEGRKVEQYVTVTTLYMSVAGRLKMIERAAKENGWRVDFAPEPTTPTGVPGYLEMQERIVYREYVEISQMEDGHGLGSKPGTAWVPRSGGNQAAGSNPYEKVETSARGRALAAWGFGVLPGSGVASLEEVQQAAQNAASVARDRGRGGNGGGDARKPRAELIADLMTILEEVRQLRGDDETKSRTKLARYVKSTFGIDIATEGHTEGEGDDAEEVVDAIDLARVKDGQLVLTINALKDTRKKLADDATKV